MALTYEPIATTTLGSAQSNITFSSIPQTYTDLILVASGLQATGQDGMAIQVGNTTIDTGTSYSATILQGTGTAAQSTRETSVNYINGGLVDSTTIGNNIFHFMNYANTTTYKTVLTRANVASWLVRSTVGLWRSTSAINTIKIGSGNGAGGFGRNLNTGFTATLYGIKSA